MELQSAGDYREREVEAAHMVLIEIGQVLGSFRSKFVVVGGTVPMLMFTEARPSHVGTLDIDLDLDPKALSDGEYRDLVEALETHGYERGKPGLKDFQLRRWIKLDDGGEPVAVLVDLLMPRDAKTDQNKEKLVSGLRVQGIDAGQFALDHHATMRIAGKMPDGRNNSVELLVATIPALLVMKGFALVGRPKNKDAYDIYFCVRNFAGGPERLAEDCREFLDHPIAVQGLANIASKFRSVDDYGPQTVKLFVTESSALGDMTPDQIQYDAYGQVHAFLKILGFAG